MARRRAGGSLTKTPNQLGGGLAALDDPVTGKAATHLFILFKKRGRRRSCATSPTLKGIEQVSQPFHTPY